MHADKWAPLGAIFTALCALGVRPATVILSFLGLDFLIRDAVLIPALVGFLLLSLAAFHGDRDRHGRAAPILLGWAGAVLSVAGLWISSYVVVLGLGLLVIAALWNWRATSQAPTKPARRRVPRGPRSPRR